MDQTKRVVFLDGLRGAAILLVVLFHAYARWPEVVRYGDKFAEFPIFRFGFLGVQLFFMISGFVILMTLERCSGFAQFLYRRWLRLFPAMMIVSPIILSTALFLPERPLGIPALRDMIPGLTFIQPDWWEVILGSPQGYLEGSFWTLYIEVKFYVVFGLLFFLAGENVSILGLLILFMLSLVWSGSTFSKLLDANYMGWFAAGALFCKYHRTANKRWMVMGVISALASALSIRADGREGAVEAGIVLVSFFAAALASKSIQSILSTRILCLLGFMSYPLYLLHENLMVGLIVKLGNSAAWMPDVLLPVLPILLCVAVSWILAAYGEPFLRARLEAAFAGRR
ncbi:MAG: acyltransferase [Candidatus Omnitrophica bacterium]|nr:acyltransferase [Candidatus Omnitrophota bacterium]